MKKDPTPANRYRKPPLSSSPGHMEKWKLEVKSQRNTSKVLRSSSYSPDAKLLMFVNTLGRKWTSRFSIGEAFFVAALHGTELLPSLPTK